MNALIAWKPIGNENMASSRFRAFLPCQYLQEAGWNCEIFNPKNLYRYKVVIFQKDYYSQKSLNLAKSLKNNGIKIGLDLCDNDLYNPHNYTQPQIVAQRLTNFIEIVDFLTVSTPTLKKHLRDFVPRKEIVVIDDTLDYRSSFLTDYYVKLKRIIKIIQKSKYFKIVWYGNNRIEPQDPVKSGMIDIQKVIPCIEKISAEFPLKLTVISNSKLLFDEYLAGVSFPVQYLEWNSKNFAYMFKQNDVCLIPIEANPFTICKSNNRVLLSILMGVPVIADKIPSYEEFSDFILFSNWENNLRTYASNEKLKQYHIKIGKDYITSKYSKDRAITQWSSLFEKFLS